MQRGHLHDGPRVHRSCRRAANSEGISVTWLRPLNAPTAGLCMKLDTRRLPLTIRVRRTAKSAGSTWVRRTAQASHTTNSSGCQMARMFDRVSYRGFASPASYRHGCRLTYGSQDITMEIGQPCLPAKAHFGRPRLVWSSTLRAPRTPRGKGNRAPRRRLGSRAGPFIFDREPDDISREVSGNHEDDVVRDKPHGGFPCRGSRSMISTTNFAIKSGF